MKRISAIVLSITLLLSLFCFVSCDFNRGDDETEDFDDVVSSGNDESEDVLNQNNSTQKQDQSQNQENGDGQKETQGEASSKEDSKFKEYTITYSTGVSAFSAGKAFIKCDESGYTCIDKNGNSLFDVSGSNEYITLCSGFYNGIATFQGAKSGTFLCDEKGNKIYADVVGGSSFAGLEYVAFQDAFKDGYIFVRKTTTDFSGSHDEIAIVNYKMEIVCDYSADLLDLYNKYAGYSYYYAGYLAMYDYYGTDNYVALNLKTGKETAEYSTFKEWVENEKIPLKYQSDVWEPDIRNKVGYYYEDLTKYNEGEHVLDLSQYTNAQFGEFVNGLADIAFTVQESSGKYKYFFTIIDETGAFKFEPIEVDGNSYNVPKICRLDEAGAQPDDCGKFLVITSTNGTDYTYTIFDVNGKQKEIKLGYSMNVCKVGEGLILGLVKAKTNYNLVCFDFDLNKK